MASESVSTGFQTTGVSRAAFRPSTTVWDWLATWSSVSGP